MLSESHPSIRMIVRFLMLPWCFLKTIDWSTCPRTRLQVARDLLYSLFILRNYPDNYGPCRLWERPRSEWPLYYGSGYNPLQRSRLRKAVHPFHLEQALRDKEVVEGLCHRMQLDGPKTLGVLSPDSTMADVEELFGRTGDRRVIVKPVNGHAGIGVTILEREGSSITFRSGKRSGPASSFRPPERCLVQELVRQRLDIARIAPSSLNTVRVLSLLTRADEFMVIGTTMRFGRAGAFIDNWSAGGIAVGIDAESGRARETGFDKVGRPFRSHPDSGVVFSELQIDGWNELIAFAERVHRAFPFFRLLGMDLAFSEQGIVLIEINNDADLVFQEQTSGPLLAKRRVWECFREYGLLYNSPQASLHEMK